MHKPLVRIAPVHSAVTNFDWHVHCVAGVQRSFELYRGPAIVFAALQREPIGGGRVDHRTRVVVGETILRTMDGAGELAIQLHLPGSGPDRLGQPSLDRYRRLSYRRLNDKHSW